MRIDRDQVLRFRARSGALAARLAPVAHRAAAWGGLQDSAPRSGLLSLHARLAGVGPQSWSDHRLAQVWGPRLAIYLVPWADYPVFTLGRLPRHDAERSPLERTAAAVERALDGSPRRVNEVFIAAGDPPGHLVRAAGATGRFLLRWDARTNTVVPVGPPQRDPEDARRELARRFLHWLGPATADSFARWAAVHPADADQTWRALASELVTVSVFGTDRSILASDLAALHEAEPVSTVRLLPPNDPYLWADRRLLVADQGQYDALYHPKREAAGAILVDCRIVGTWARRQSRVTLRPWAPLDPSTEDAVTATALDLAGPMGRPVVLRKDA